jgi:hypothetical protein
MKKITLYIIAAILLSLLISSVSAEALTIPEYLRPINEPFNIAGDIDASGNGISGAAAGTIIILQIIAGTLLYFAAPIAIIMIAIAALNMVIGGADSEKIEQSKKSLTWTIIGLLAIILSYSLVRFVIGLIINAATT